MAYGFICADNATTAFTAAGGYTSLLLHEDTAADTGSLHGALPSTGRIGTPELVVNDTGTTMTALRGFATWDSAGTDIFLPLTVLTSANNDWVAQQATPDHEIMTSIKYDRPYRASAEQTTAGKVYLWVTTTTGSGAGTIIQARLNWETPGQRG